MEVSFATEGSDDSLVCLFVCLLWSVIHMRFKRAPEWVFLRLADFLSVSSMIGDATGISVPEARVLLVSQWVRQSHNVNCTAGTSGWATEHTFRLKTKLALDLKPNLSLCCT